MLIQVILIAGLVILTLVCLLALKSRLGTRLFVAAQLLVGILLVLFPDATNWLAKKVGVGRGTDLLFYLVILVLYAGAIIILAKFRRLERQITELTRQIALKNAEDSIKTSPSGNKEI